MLPYLQSDRFMKRQSRPRQVSWQSSYYARVHVYYRNEEAQQALVQPFPTSHIDHYPLDGWKLLKDLIEYMLYEIQPKDSLLGLLEDELYKQVLTLVAEAQLLREANVVGDKIEVAKGKGLALYYINKEIDKRYNIDAQRYGYIVINKESYKLRIKVRQTKDILKREKERVQNLYYC